MPRYTVEQKAQGVAEYWLTGSSTRVAEELGIGSHHTVAEWVGIAEAPKTAAHKKLAKRAVEIYETRQTSLDALYQRTLDLQLRDLEGADFRDRTGLLKIVGEQILLQKGKPTAIVESRDKLDFEIQKLLDEMGDRERDGAAASG